MDGSLARETEKSFRRASVRIGRAEDACFGKQLMPQGSSGQFQNSIPLPMAITNGQQSPHMLPIHGCDVHQPMLSEDAYLIQRNLSSSASIALHSYFEAHRPECSRRGPVNALNDLNQNSCLQLQFGVHNPYQCYDMNFLGVYNLNPDGVGQSHVDYPLELYQPNIGYDTEIESRASSFGSRGITKIGEHLYAQTQNALSSGSPGSSNIAT